MDATFDFVRRRLSFSPSPSRTSTKYYPNRSSEISIPRLSKQEIDEILDSPYETNYTYSESAAYKPHIGSREYIHPRLCRRIPATPSSALRKEYNADLTSGSYFWHWYQSFNFSGTLFYSLQLLFMLMLAAMQFTFKQVPLFLYHMVRFLAIRCLQYTLLWPIMTPYYAFRNYWYRARFIWSTSKSFWSFLRWIWLWLTERKVHDEVTVDLQTHSISEGRSVNLERKATFIQDYTNRKYAVWLFLYLPLLIFLLWAGNRLYHSKHSALQDIVNNKAFFLKEQKAIDKMQGTVNQKVNSTMLKEIPMNKPSEKLPPNLAHPIGGPALNAQEEIESAHQLHHNHEQPEIGQIVGGRFLPHFLDFSSPISGAIEWTAHLGQSVAHVFYDIFLAFITATSQFGSNLFEALKQMIIFILGIPLHCCSFVWNWLCIPLANAVAYIVTTIWNFLVLLGRAFANFPIKIWTILRESIFKPIALSMELFVSKMFDALNWIYDFITRIPTTIWHLFQKWSSSTADFLYRIPHVFRETALALTYPFKLIWTKLNDLMPTYWNALKMFRKHTMSRAEDWYNYTTEFVSEKAGSLYTWICLSVQELKQKTLSIITTFVSKIYSIFSMFYGKIIDTIVGIWRNAKEFKLKTTPTAPANLQQDNFLSRTPELEELSNDHPLIKRLRQMMLQALAEERYFVDQRIRKWVEHNVLVMKSQLQRLEPKLVEETKEKVESEIFPPPPPSDDEYRNELSAEWQEKMNEILKGERVKQHQNTLSLMQQMNGKISEFATNLNSKIREKHANLSMELNELKNQQRELEERSVTKQQLEAVRRESGEPLVRQEKLIEKMPDGKEVTREITVLLNHIQRKIEEFDEEALLNKVRKLIKQELRKYDADRTAMPDFALESSGGCVLSTRCTVQYNEKSRIQKLFGISLWYSSYSPRTVIQRKGYGASAGECWAYNGGHGFLTIGLSKRINVTAVSYEHLPMELSPEGHIRTAPRNFLIWSYQDVDDTNTRLLLGNFTYHVNGEPLQIFPVQQWDTRLTQIVELETLTNWDAPVTCLYRFRVHGDMQKVIPEVETDPATNELEADHI